MCSPGIHVACMVLARASAAREGRDRRPWSAGSKDCFLRSLREYCLCGAGDADPIPMKDHVEGGHSADSSGELAAVPQGFQLSAGLLERGEKMVSDVVPPGLAETARSTSGVPGSRAARSTSWPRAGGGPSGCRMAWLRVCRKSIILRRLLKPAAATTRTPRVVARRPWVLLLVTQLCWWFGAGGGRSAAALWGSSGFPQVRHEVRLPRLRGVGTATSPQSRQPRSKHRQMHTLVAERYS